MEFLSGTKLQPWRFSNRELREVGEKTMRAQSERPKSPSPSSQRAMRDPDTMNGIPMYSPLFAPQPLPVSSASPFERCSPRYHLSDSPDYYSRDISKSNPLSLLPPLSIRSRSMQSAKSLPFNTHSYTANHSKMNVMQPVDEDRGGKEKNDLPSLSEPDLTFEMEWSPLSDDDDRIIFEAQRFW